MKNNFEGQSDQPMGEDYAMPGEGLRFIGFGDDPKMRVYVAERDMLFTKPPAEILVEPFSPKDLPAGWVMTTLGIPFPCVPPKSIDEDHAMPAEPLKTGEAFRITGTVMSDGSWVDWIEAADDEDDGA